MQESPSPTTVLDNLVCRLAELEGAKVGRGVAHPSRFPEDGATSDYPKCRKEVFDLIEGHPLITPEYREFLLKYGEASVTVDEDDVSPMDYFHLTILGPENMQIDGSDLLNGRSTFAEVYVRFAPKSGNESGKWDNGLLYAAFGFNPQRNLVIDMASAPLRSFSFDESSYHWKPFCTSLHDWFEQLIENGADLINRAELRRKYLEPGEN